MSSVRSPKVAPPDWNQSAPANQRCTAVAGAEAGGHAVTVTSASTTGNLDFANHIARTPVVTLQKTQQNLTAAEAETSSPLSVQLGDRIRYRLTVQNGDAPANDVEVIDQISSGAQTARLSPVAVDPRCISTAVGTGTRFRCDVGDMAPGQLVTLVIEARALDSRCTIVGTRFNDPAASLAGTAGPDRICGGGGGDVANAGDGADFVYGNRPLGIDGSEMKNEAWIDLDGNDSHSGAEAVSTVVARQVASKDGEDRLSGGADRDEIFGSDQADTISGQDARDLLRGDAGDDVVNGDDGDDIVEGGSGDDFLRGSDGEDRLWAEAGNDTLDAGPGVGRMLGGDGNDRLLGDAAHDFAYGGDGNDRIETGGDRDEVDGGDGADSIAAGDGPDDVLGGDGNDCFDSAVHRACPANAFHAGITPAGKPAGPYTAQLNGGSQADRISGGAGVDRLDGGDADSKNLLDGGSSNKDYCSFGHPTREKRTGCELP